MLAKQYKAAGGGIKTNASQEVTEKPQGLDKAEVAH